MKEVAAIANSAVYLTKVIFGGQVSNSLKNAFKYSQTQTKATTASYTAMSTAVTAAAVAIPAAIGAAYIGAGVHAAKFQSEMADVATLLTGDVDSKVAALGASVQSVSVLAAQHTDKMSSGLYEVVSAFGDTAESAGQLEVAAKSAVAGNADIASSVKLLSAVTKGYGDTSVEAMSKVADMAFETVRLGQTTYPELAASMGQTIAVAEAMGMKQHELFGTTATLTGVTGNTAEVITQVKSSLSGLMKPTSEMQAALKALGYENGRAALETEGYGRLLIKLKKLVNDDEIAFANLFGRVEAKTAVLALTGAQSEALAEKTMAMANASGAAERAFQKKADTASFAWSQMTVMGSVMAQRLGSHVLPAVVDVGSGLYTAFVENEDEINGFINAVGVGMVAAFNGVCVVVGGTVKLVNSAVTVVRAFSKYSDEAEAVILGLTVVIGGYNAVQKALYIQTWIGVHALDAYAIATGAAATVTGAFGSAVAFVTSPIGMVIVAIGAMVAVGWYLYRNWDTVTANVAAFWSDRIIPAVEGIGDFFKQIFTGVTDMFRAEVNMWIMIANAMIGGLNSIHVEIPEWVPKVGGNSYGVNLPLIPMFANGGFTNKPSIFGEAGPEAAIPLKRNNPRSIALLNETARRLGVVPHVPETVVTSVLPFLTGLKQKMTPRRLEAGKVLKTVDESRISSNTYDNSSIHVHLHLESEGGGSDQPDFMKLVEDAARRGVRKGIEIEKNRKRRVALGTS